MEYYIRCYFTGRARRNPKGARQSLPQQLQSPSVQLCQRRQGANPVQDYKVEQPITIKHAKVNPFSDWSILFQDDLGGQ